MDADGYTIDDIARFLKDSVGPGGAFILASESGGDTMRLVTAGSPSQVMGLLGIATEGVHEAVRRNVISRLIGEKGA